MRFFEKSLSNLHKEEIEKKSHLGAIAELLSLYGRPGSYLLC